MQTAYLKSDRVYISYFSEAGVSILGTPSLFHPIILAFSRPITTSKTTYNYPYNVAPKVPQIIIN